MALLVLGTPEVYLDEISGFVNVVDTTDYIAQGIDPLYAFGYIAITGATNYNNLSGTSPDIKPDVSNTNIIPIPLPLGSDGHVAAGTYNFTYKVLYNNVDPQDVATFTFTKVVDYTVPDVCIKHDWNCTNSTFTSEETTKYPANITVLNRVHTIEPPLGSNKPTLTNNLTVNVYLLITTGTWQSYIKNTLLVTLGDSWYVQQYAEATRTTADVTCDTNLCKIVCCLMDIDEEVRIAECENGKYISPLLKQRAANAHIRVIEFFMAERCGNTELAAEIVEKLKKESGCKDDCKCNSGQPIPIIPLQGIGQSIAVDSPDGTITVTPEVIGNILYYHIGLSQSIINIINNFTPITVQVDPGSVGIITVNPVDGNPKIFYIGFSGDLWNEAVLKDNIHIVQNATPPGYVTITQTDIEVSQYATNNLYMKTPANWQAVAYPNGNSNIATDIACVKFSGWRDTAGADKEYHVLVDMITEKGTILPTLNDVKSIAIETMADESPNADNTYLRFYSPVDGHPLQWTEIFNSTPTPTENVTIRIQITQKL